MDLHITQELVARSRKLGGEGCANKCPIALDLLDKGYIKPLAGEDCISYQVNVSWVKDPKTPIFEKLIYKTPVKVRHWMTDFDNGKDVPDIVVSLTTPHVVPMP